MNERIEKIGLCVERGKVNKSVPFPTDMKGLDGADELTRQALESGVGPDAILQACNEGMRRIGEKFGRNEVFVPDLLMAAKAMNAVMAHLLPFFKSGTVKSKGHFVIGTVAGDLHDIGKNLVKMVVEGNGWEVVDLGVDVKTDHQPAGAFRISNKERACLRRQYSFKALACRRLHQYGENGQGDQDQVPRYDRDRRWSTAVDESRSRDERERLRSGSSKRGRFPQRMSEVKEVER